MDKLNMSLDAIISSDRSNNRPAHAKKPFIKRNNSSNHDNNGGGFQKKFSPNKNFNQKNASHHVVKVSSQHDDRIGGKFNQNTQFNNNNNRSTETRPMKAVTLQRPKLITPANNHSSSSSSHTPSSTVFERLGRAGTVVIFQNLKRSVEQGDIVELCRAVGDIKEVHYHVDPKSGFGMARAIFANERDAAACVAKYNGMSNCLLVFTFILPVVSPSLFLP
jgi:hypothetical protein